MIQDSGADSSKTSGPNASRAERIYLSPPHLGDLERRLVGEAFDSNWIAPLGPQVDLFEKEMAACVGVSQAAALSSGTAALHLALRIAGVGPGDDVFCSSLTFIATASPIVYQGANPVFVDSDRQSWNMDPGLLADELKRRSQSGCLPKCVIVVDVFGQAADFGPILEVCGEFGTFVVEDAAEALGADYRGRMAGSLGRLGVLSFNGNKIITTSGGGMLLSNESPLIEKARFLAAQARDPAPHYQHSVVGYNYRLSNLLAAVGRGQLRYLEERVRARRRNFEFYRSNLADLPGVGFMPEPPYGRSSRWLSCITLDPGEFGTSREDVRQALERENIEARPLWKPLHLQPVFSGCSVVGGSVSEELFEKGLCLPSGSSLTGQDLERIVGIIRRVRATGR